MRTGNKAVFFATVQQSVLRRVMVNK